MIVGFFFINANSWRRSCVWFILCVIQEKGIGYRGNEIRHIFIKEE